MGRLNVKVGPGSSRNQIVGWLGDALKIKVTAPPEKGKLNDRNLPDTGITKPWKVLERQEQFLVTYQQPQAVPGHVRDFNRESARSRHR